MLNLYVAEMHHPHRHAELVAEAERHRLARLARKRAEARPGWAVRLGRGAVRCAGTALVAAGTWLQALAAAGGATRVPPARKSGATVDGDAMGAWRAWLVGWEVLAAGESRA